MQDFDDLQHFLTHWYDCKPEELAWHDPLPVWLQPDVAEFYQRFGQLTCDQGPFSSRDLPPPLAAQDIIVPVDKLTKREDGGAIIIRENQDSWTAGQMPESNMLWSSINLRVGDTPYPGHTLFDMGFPIKEALITHALHETVMCAVDAGPQFDLKEWDAAERDIVENGTVILRRYITPDEGILRIGWNDNYMASGWADKDSFTWLVRKGDRNIGPRPTPYTVGRPRPATLKNESGSAIIKHIVSLFRSDK